MENNTGKNARIYIIVSTILLALSIFPALVMAMFSPMLMDSPGSENNLITILIMIGVVSYPFVTIISGVISWILYTKGKQRISVVLISIPYLHFIVMILLFIALEFFCDGNFSC